MLVGCQRVQFGIEREQRRALAHHAGMEHKVTIHKDDHIVFAETGARHGAKDERNRDAFAGLVLADNAQRNIAVVADKFEMVGNLDFIAQLA